jgi:hypothetical protein
MDEDERFVFNGVDASTGRYLLPPLTFEDVSRLALGERLDPDHLDELQSKHARSTEATFGPAAGVDPRDLAQAGWAMIAAVDADDAVLEALRPLRDHRRAQASKQREQRYQELTREHGYRSGESKPAFLARQGVGPGPAVPDRLPYYLLLVGDPESIPFTFQYQLGVQYAVGRVCFETAEEYAAYAEAVVRAETTSPAARSHTAAFFAPANPGDRATALSAAELVTPLADWLATEQPDWEVHRSVGEAADKAMLTELLGGSRTPSLLLTASHGIGLPLDHPRQRRDQGALVCQDWAGPGAALDPETYVAADDIARDASLANLIAFHFACFGAGTPEMDGFSHRTRDVQRPIARRSFVAALPQRLLSHERGGALAVAGHVDRAWGYSIAWPGAGRQTEAYRSSLERLLAGHPIGSAFEYVNERYAELASDLATLREDVSVGKRPDRRAIATMWTARNDARGFTILGDPAVRLASVRPDGGSDAIARSSTDGGERVRHVVDGARPEGACLRHKDPGTADEEVQAQLDREHAVRQQADRLAAAMEQLAHALAQAVEDAAASAAAVEVATYTSDHPSAAVYDHEARRFEGARLRTLSRVGVAGDIQLLVDERDGLDDRVWACHVAMVEQAQRVRTDLIRNASASLVALRDPRGPGG